MKALTNGDKDAIYQKFLFKIGKEKFKFKKIKLVH